jgi:hypothetical protein
VWACRTLSTRDYSGFRADEEKLRAAIDAALDKLNRAALSTPPQRSLPSAHPAGRSQRPALPPRCGERLSHVGLPPGRARRSRALPSRSSSSGARRARVRQSQPLARATRIQPTAGRAPTRSLRRAPRQSGALARIAPRLAPPFCVPRTLARAGLGRGSGGADAVHSAARAYRVACLRRALEGSVGDSSPKTSPHPLRPGASFVLRPMVRRASLPPLQMGLLQTMQSPV